VTDAFTVSIAQLVATKWVSPFAASGAATRLFPKYFEISCFNFRFERSENLCNGLQWVRSFYCC